MICPWVQSLILLGEFPLVWDIFPIENFINSIPFKNLTVKYATPASPGCRPYQPEAIGPSPRWERAPKLFEINNY